ncbi:MAG: glycosyltransferase [Burkholderiaceae bacterium]|jgi:GT2 family glycosyltransferase|nr:glycosyltransferase [Burkholderiaceae bacterium]
MTQPFRRQPRPVTVSVVSHAQGDLVGLLLQDLDQHCHAVVDRVIVTCNVHEPLPFAPGDFGVPVEIIANARPQGFGANHNQAFARCASAWFLIVNPDVRLTNDALTALLARATGRDALLAPQEVDPNGVPLDGVRGPITPLELLRRRLLGRPGMPPRRGGWVKGMFMLARAEAFRQVRGFDPRFFLYGEDADLCARLLLAGWQVTHVPQVTVTHAWQRSSKHTLKHLRWHITSLLRLWTSRAFWRYWALIRRWNS